MKSHSLLKCCVTHSLLRLLGDFREDQMENVPIKLQSWTERVENFLQRRTNKDYNYFRASNTTPPLPPESMLVNAHTTMIWCSNNIGLRGRGVSNGSYPRMLILDVTKYDNKSNFLNYFVHDCVRT